MPASAAMNAARVLDAGWSPYPPNAHARPNSPELAFVLPLQTSPGFLFANWCNVEAFTFAGSR